MNQQKLILFLQCNKVWNALAPVSICQISCRCLLLCYVMVLFIPQAVYRYNSDTGTIVLSGFMDIFLPLSTPNTHPYSLLVEELWGTITRRRHSMETFSALLTLCEENLLVTDWFQSHRTNNEEHWWIFCRLPSQGGEKVVLPVGCRGAHLK